MKKLIVASIIAAASCSSAKAACSYTAYVTEDAKYNSNGVSLATGATKAAAAAILRQERVYSGSTECGLHNTGKRAQLEQQLRRGNMSRSTINRIVYGETAVTVVIDGNRADVY